MLYLLRMQMDHTQARDLFSGKLLHCTFFFSFGVRSRRENHRALTLGPRRNNFPPSPPSRRPGVLGRATPTAQGAVQRRHEREAFETSTILKIFLVMETRFFSLFWTNKSLMADARSYSVSNTNILICSHYGMMTQT